MSASESYMYSMRATILDARCLKTGLDTCHVLGDFRHIIESTLRGSERLAAGVHMGSNCREDNKVDYFSF